MFRYNFVILNSTDNKYKIDHDAYYTICMEDLYKMPEVIVVSSALDYAPKFVKVLFNLHNSKIVNSRIHLPFKNLWYPFYFKNKFKNNKPFCFVLIDRNYTVDYLHYLKNKFNNCKIVLLHRDLRFVCESMNPELLTCKDIDLQMTFDKGESIKYNMPHFDEFESQITVPISKEYPESDVFFAGKAKNRLEKLLKIYKILTNAGLKCKFYLTGVDKNKRTQLQGIEYADKFMSYKDMLYHSVNSRCILDINQENADGYTSRFLEAVMFNKRLLTDNKSIASSEFYSEDNIQIIDNYQHINTSFVRNNKAVDYHYTGQFSPVKLLFKIEKILLDKFKF